MTEPKLARAILSLADTAGMPDSYWQTDSRVALAREVLGVSEDGRYSHAHMWSAEGGTTGHGTATAETAGSDPDGASSGSEVGASLAPERLSRMREMLRRHGLEADFDALLRLVPDRDAR